jgi:hypothetical protein
MNPSMKKHFYIILLSMFLLSCNGDSPSAEKSAGISKEELPIKTFIRKLRSVELPFYFRGGTDDSFDESKLTQLNKNSGDTLFFMPGEGSNVYVYGLVGDTTNFYSVLYFERTEDIYPILVTFSKTGRELSKETLVVNGCGSDCGLVYCSYTARLDKNLNISIADTAKYEGICDSNGDYLPNTDTTYIYSKSGKVKDNGIITFGNELLQKNKGIR